MGFDKTKRPILAPRAGSDIAGLPVDFSTSEQATPQKWIDGKTIYQKTVQFTTFPDNSQTSVEHGVPDIEYVVRIQGVMKTQAGTDGWRTLPRVGWSSSINDLAELAVDGTYCWFRSVGDYTATGWDTTDAYVTIWYTKTG